MTGKEKDDDVISTRTEVTELSSGGPVMVEICRPAYTQSQFDEQAELVQSQGAWRAWLFIRLKPPDCMRLVNLIVGLLPFLSMFRGYKPCHFLCDLWAGLTLGIMHIPQGIAYAMLANLPPIYGLYTSFFPTIVYFFFGTSKHISLGTMALVNLMVGASVNRICKGAPGQQDGNSNNNQCNLDVAVTVTFLTGIVQLVMGLLRLGVVTEYLSTPLTRAFTTGAAVYIFTSQLSPIFGFEVPNAHGMFGLLQQYRSFFAGLWQTNLPSLLMALLCSLVIILTKSIVNPRVLPIIKMPIPVEFFLLVLTTAISYSFQFAKEFNVVVVGEIQQGFPRPTVPKVSLMPGLFTDSISLAVIAFVTVFALAKTFAEEGKYSINSNQELLAIGFANVIPAFFNSFVSSASLSRSCIQYQSGGKTQVAGLISCCVLFIVIMFLGPMFYHLPKCVLGAIIIVNLKSIFMQFTDLNFHFKVTFYDGLTWLVTFMAVVMIELNTGLLIGLIFSFFTVILRTQITQIQSLGTVPETECYMDLKKYHNTREVEGVRIYRIETSIYYANHSKLQEILLDLKLHTNNSASNYGAVAPDTVNEDAFKEKSSQSEGISDLILDCSIISFIDSDGIIALNKVAKGLKEDGINMYLSGCTENLHRNVREAVRLGKLTETPIYLTIHDAVLSILAARFP